MTSSGASGDYFEAQVVQGVNIDYNYEFSEECLSHDDIENLFIELDEKLTTQDAEANLDQFVTGEDGVLEYNLNDYRHRGVVIIIANTKFDGEPDVIQEITSIHPADMKRFETVLSTNIFSYQQQHIIKFQNVTKGQMEKILDCASKLKGLKDCASFVLHFTGHGSMVFANLDKGEKEDREFIHDCGYGKGKGFKTISIAKITSYFNDNICPALKGKPRIFFIDTCRDDPNELHPLYDRGSEFQVQSEMKGSEPQHPEQLRRLKGGKPSQYDDYQFVSTICPNNFIIVRSAVKGQKSATAGYISLGMEEALEEMGNCEKIDLLEFITCASRKIQRHCEFEDISRLKSYDLPDFKEITDDSLQTLRILPFQSRLLANIVYRKKPDEDQSIL